MAQLTRLTDPGAVRKAIEQFDKVGREQFLKQYGFGKAVDYFLRYQDRYYDSKAIVAVAYGIENPRDGPLSPHDFTGGKHVTARALSRLGFDVVVDPFRYLILTENEAFADPEFEKWQDVTGERYHFPNGYRNKVVPGREFIYYKGRRRASGTGEPEYFGWGRVGTVALDPTTSDEPATYRNWLAEIDEYRPFKDPVPFKVAGEYLELSSKTAPDGYWRAGVREISDVVFRRILRHAGVQLPGEAASERKEQLVHVNVLPPNEAMSLMVRTVAPAQSLGGDKKPRYAGRQSGRAKEIGDAAERVVLEWLRSTASLSKREKIFWCAANGEVPGWDIEDRSNGKQVVAYEVKGTNGSLFPAVEVTANEWTAAERMRQFYNLVLVTGCESNAPTISIIRDPWGCMQAGTLAASPTGFRLERASEVE